MLVGVTFCLFDDLREEAVPRTNSSGGVAWFKHSCGARVGVAGFS